MRRPGRISNSNSFSCCEWLLVVLLLAPELTTTQYASSLYNSQFYDYNNQQQVQQRNVYPDIPVTYNQQYPAAVQQSTWSTAPIVVNDEASRLDQDQRRYLPVNYHSNRETYPNEEAVRSNNYNFNYNYDNNIHVPTTRAANHNYNNVPGYFYSTQQHQQQPQQQRPQSQRELEQRELLAASDSRREEEQIVRLGGNRSLAPNNYNNNNYYTPPQSLQSRDFEAKYAKHYADYLRKYPQRLQPLYNTGSPYVDK
ncbi:hypothetical protein ACLKA7_016724 [Drosophila subpalustris]